MTVKDAASALQRHLMQHIEAQDFFRGEAPEVEDDMAFEVRSALPMVGQPKIALMFSFHDAIPRRRPEGGAVGRRLPRVRAGGAPRGLRDGAGRRPHVAGLPGRDVTCGRGR